MKRSASLIQMITTTLLVLVCAFILLMWVIESSGRLQSLISGRWGGIKATLSAGDVSGIERGTAVICQGHRVGSVLGIEMVGAGTAADVAKKPTFEITVLLDQFMANHTVTARSAAPMLGLLQQTPIELTVAAGGTLLDPARPTLIPLERDQSNAGASQKLVESTEKVLESLRALTAAFTGTQKDDPRQNLSAIVEDGRKLVASLDRIAAALDDPRKAAPGSLSANLDRTLASLRDASDQLNEILTGLAGPKVAEGPGAGKPQVSPYAVMRDDLVKAAGHHKQFAQELAESDVTKTFPRLVSEMQDTTKELRRLILLLQERTDALGRTGVGSLLFDNKPKEPAQFKPLLPPAPGGPSKR